MKKIYRRLFEEEVNNTNGESKNSSSSNNSTAVQNAQNQTKIAQLQKEIVDLQGRLNMLKRTYDQNVYTLRQQIDLRNKTIATLGGTPVSGTVTESQIAYVKSKKLFESAQTSKVDELCAAINTANENLETLSYHIDTRSALSFARKLLVFLNDKLWNDGSNHWEEFSDYFRSLLVKSTVSFSRRELNEFLEEFERILKNNTTYNWIFGK